MKIPIYQIDAFTSRIFSGNPAAVCPLEAWLEDSLMQAIAQENNLSETAFFVPGEEPLRIRWFTPSMEVDLCGHATLASAFLIFNYLDTSLESVTFTSRSGELVVEKNGELLTMNFPAQPADPCPTPPALAEGLGMEPIEALRSEDFLAVFASEDQVRELHPDMKRLRDLDLRGVIVTARGDEADFVSRFFAPKVGIDEDPVTGSAHTVLIPYWSQKLNKKDMKALQVSQRGGEIFCQDRGERVLISGHAALYLTGRITV
ncbi:MAG: PhzF family phenazine biosynthesis protein [Deltaproteobacteria bacterium]|nr:PhzF family phenazine biosynthesis protein [Deltaproteobacteria bacterium]